MQFIYGTAQLMNNYGIYKYDKNLKKEQLKKIFRLLLKNKVKSLDTASDYTGVFRKLSYKDLNKFNIITKIPSIKKNKIKNIEFFILNEITKAKKYLKTNTIHTVLMHDPYDLIDNKIKKETYKTLNFLKKNNKIKKFGVSCNEIKEVKKIITDFNVDIIQFPYNVFDQTLNDIKILKVLKKKNIELHLRSIFLQGLLLNYKKLKINKKFQKPLNNWNKFLIKNNISALEACSNFFKLFNYKKKKLVVGFNNFEQVQKFINTFSKKKKLLKYNKLKLYDYKLIKPYKWHRK